MRNGGARRWHLGAQRWKTYTLYEILSCLVISLMLTDDVELEVIEGRVRELVYSGGAQLLSEYHRHHSELARL